MSERHICYFWVCTRSMKYMIWSVDGASFASNWPIFLGNTLEILRGLLRMMLWQKQLLQNAAILGVWANLQGFRHFMAFLLKPAMPTAIGCPAKKSVALSGISAVPKVSSSWCFHSFANPLFEQLQCQYHSRSTFNQHSIPHSMYLTKFHQKVPSLMHFQVGIILLWRKTNLSKLVPWNLIPPMSSIGILQELTLQEKPLLGHIQAALLPMRDMRYPRCIGEVTGESASTWRIWNRTSRLDAYPYNIAGEMFVTHMS